MKGPDFGNLMSQANKMRKEMARVQESLKQRVVDGTAGGGMVTAQVNGALELVSIKVDPEVLKPDEKEMLEDLIVAAVNQATQEAQKMMQEEMGKITGRMKIPELF